MTDVEATLARARAFLAQHGAPVDRPALSYKNMDIYSDSFAQTMAVLGQPQTKSISTSAVQILSFDA